MSANPKKGLGTKGKVGNLRFGMGNYVKGWDPGNSIVGMQMVGFGNASKLGMLRFGLQNVGNMGTLMLWLGNMGNMGVLKLGLGNVGNLGLLMKWLTDWQWPLATHVPLGNNKICGTGAP